MNVFWLMVITAAAVLVQLILFKALGQKGISYSRTLSKDRARVGDEIDMIEDISLRRRFPVPWVRAESRIPKALAFPTQKDLTVEDEMFHRSVFTLLPYRHIHRKYHLTCTHRGLYSLETVTLTTGDLLGMHMSHKTVQLDAKVVVYPRLLRFDSIDLPSERWQGDTIVRRWIQPDPFLVNGIREYRTGDNLKDIHAGATARTGTLQIKTHDYTAAPRILVVYNVQLSENQYGIPNVQERESMEDSISYAATLISWCHKNHVDFGFVSNGKAEGAEDKDIFLLPESGDRQYSRCMDAMGRLQIIRKNNPVNMLEEIGRRLRKESADIVIFTCYKTRELEKAASDLRAQGHGVSWHMIHREKGETNAVI